MLKKFGFVFFVLCAFLIIGAGAPETKRVVYADITGDLFHAGHVAFLRKAKALGDYLIVGVITDDHVETYKRRPVLSLKDRAAVVRGCKYVDEVIEGVSPICTKEWIAKKGISVVVHGDDFDLKDPLTLEQYGAAIKAGIFQTVPYTPGISTTDVISRIVKRSQEGDSFSKKR